jgi:hypothetical protein
MTAGLCQRRHGAGIRKTTHDGRNLTAHGVRCRVRAWAVETMSEEERTLEEIRQEMRVGFTRLETKIDDLERLVLRLARKVDELDHKIDDVAASVRVVSE